MKTTLIKEAKMSTYKVTLRDWWKDHKAAVAFGSLVVAVFAVHVAKKQSEEKTELQKQLNNTFSHGYYVVPSVNNGMFVFPVKETS